jgi:arabinogalactan oligomer/maltooligosaccharide transport system substrate-binding protein
MALAALRRGKSLYGIPYVFDSVALIRNLALTGDDPLPATFAAVLDSGEALLDEGVVEQSLALQVGAGGDPYHLWPLFSSVGGTLFGLRDDGGFDEPAVWCAAFVEAMVRLSELGESGRGALRVAIGRDRALPMFISGRTPYLVCSSRALASIPADMAVEVAAVPPLGDLPARSLVSAYGFFISRNGANKRIAQDLVSHFLARTETGERLVEIQPRPPVQSDAMRRVERDDPRVAPYIEQCRTGILMPNHPRMAEVWSSLGRAQRDVISGADPVDAGQRVADVGWRILNDIEP